ncbi:SRPBCC family protein [Marinobacter zhejiangensis]|uniref:Uncharacterized conserved protein YndB, AHSA1/START domain n=1 Tax=Marinobacter zhejiangensis TaxID=488535 RepID=A0A1I4TQL2_9GAMM|nr:SRPBCC family protein [Marinobacter zhejiangensis]SFM78910.1 Uncharacterized conserved protein YndB, AHSA1/START domain [Marinobacter zhejiangensis]
MTSAANSWGALEVQDHRVQVRLERLLAHPQARVWDMLTDSQLLPLWLAPGSIEARPGGRVTIDFGNSGCPIDSPLTSYDPPHRLCYSWSQVGEPLRPVTWLLQEEGEGTRLTLCLDLPDDGLVATACAGWDAHLEMLMAALEGIAIHFPASRFRQARQAFSELVPG